VHASQPSDESRPGLAECHVSGRVLHRWRSPKPRSHLVCRAAPPPNRSARPLHRPRLPPPRPFPRGQETISPRSRSSFAALIIGAGIAFAGVEVRRRSQPRS